MAVGLFWLVGLVGCWLVVGVECYVPKGLFGYELTSSRQRTCSDTVHSFREAARQKIRGSDWSTRGLCEVRGLDCCERKNDPERICEEKEEEKKLMMWSRRPGTFCA